MHRREARAVVRAVQVQILSAATQATRSLQSRRRQSEPADGSLEIRFDTLPVTQKRAMKRPDLAKLVSARSRSRRGRRGELVTGLHTLPTIVQDKDHQLTSRHPQSVPSPARNAVFARLVDAEKLELVVNRAVEPSNHFLRR